MKFLANKNKIFYVKIIILMILCVELFLRQIKFHQLSYGNWLPTIYQPHEDIGFSLIPNAEGFYSRNYEWETKIKINSNGWNDYEYTLKKPAGTFRIACIGDSYTMNLEVPIENNYPKTLERILKQQVSPKIEVLNFSIDGTGPEAHYIIFRDYALKYQPDMVIHNFHDNDIKDVQLGKYYRKSYKNVVIQYQTLDKLKKGQTKVDRMFTHGLNPLKHFTLKHSHLSRLLLYPIIKRPRRDYMIYAHSNNPQYTYEEALKKTKNAIREFKTLADKHLITYFKVFLCNEETLQLDNNPNMKILQDLLNTHNIPYLDTHKTFKQSVDKQKLYWEYDSHITEEGCRLIAESVSSFLQQNGFIGG